MPYVARVTPDRRFPSWSHLKHLRVSRVVRSMHVWLIVVPVLAKFTDRVHSLSVIHALGTQFEVDLKLPFSWQLFYFSAVAFSFANLVFLLRCPSIVKDHEHPGEFHQAGKSFDQLDHYRHNAGISRDEMQRHVNDAHEQIKSVTTRYNRLFWIVYDHANGARKGSLYLGAAFYVVGMGLIGCVLVQNFVAVLALVR